MFPDFLIFITERISNGQDLVYKILNESFNY